MKMSFFIWHIYYYRAFCTVTNDDFADGNLLSHPSASFGIPTMYLLLFFFSQLLGLLTCFGFAFLLHFCRISFLHVQLSLCLCSLSRQDFATHCEPRWERRLHQLPALDPCLLPLSCICPSCKMYLSVKPNLFVQIWCYKQIKKYPKKNPIFWQFGSYLFFFGQCFKNTDSGNLKSIQVRICSISGICPALGLSLIYWTQ